MQSRYYDPEVGRFISQDSVDYADPETINGLNLYAYCNNDPVNNVDPTGHAWWHWLLGAVGVVVLCAVAVGVTVLTGGTGTLAFAVALGALKGAAIGFGVGAVAGTAIGAVAGGIYSAATGADFWDSVGQGALLGLGIGAFAGAVIGAVIGGVVGANGWYNANALEFTHNPGSSEVVLGRSGTYEVVAESRGATYFQMPDAQWNMLRNHKHVVWQINKAFLKQQINAGKTFIMASNPTSAGGYYFMKEVVYLIAKGIKWIF